MNGSFPRKGLPRVAVALLLSNHPSGILSAAEAAPATIPTSQPSAEETSLLEVAEARTRAELEVRTLAKLTKKSVGDVSDDAAATVPGLAKLAHGIDHEQKKPPAEQDAARIIDLTRRGELLRSAWQTRLTSVRTQYAVLTAETTSAPDSAAALRQLAVVEAEWKTLRMDLGTIRDSYRALATHARASADRVRDAQAKLHQSNADWEAELAKQTDGL